MRSILGIVVALVLGIFAGILIGVAIGAHGGATALAAVVGVAVAVAATFSGWALNEYSARRKSHEDAVVRGQEKYGKHADELNQHVFRPCSGATLAARMIPYPKDDLPLRGIQGYYGNTNVAISGLPNWEKGLAHMLADAQVRPAWEGAYRATSEYLTLLDKASEAIRARFEQDARTEYGAEIRFKQRNFDGPAGLMCDSTVLTYQYLSRRSGGLYQPYYVPTPSQSAQTGPPPTGPAEVRGGGSGNLPVLYGRNIAEWNPVRFQRLYDRVWGDSDLARLADSAIAAEQAAGVNVAQFRDACRLYSNTLSTAHTFEGRCVVCQNYVLT